jgi:D-alanine-D-alanine ligase
VDLMLENDGCPYVLEVNTIPGFTEKSLFPLAAREAGIPFADLCERIVDLALTSARVAPWVKV